MELNEKQNESRIKKMNDDNENALLFIIGDYQQ
jgi:hypothetical protein